MTEKSPLDMLTEVHTMLSDMTARILLLEQNLALLHDKANGRLFPSPPAQTRPANPQTIHTNSSGTSNTTSTIMANLEAGQRIIGVPQMPEQPKPDGALVHGKVHSPDQKPVAQASVVIKNQKHEIVGQLKTGSDGYWEKQLPPGKYALTYSKGGMSSSYRFVEVRPESFEIEVL